MNFDNMRKWCMSKVINIIVIAAFLFFLLFIIFVAGISNRFQSIKTSMTKTMMANAEVLSNKKIEWGIKRADNHKQPDLGSVNKKIIDEFDGMAIGNDQVSNVYLTFDVGYEGGYTEKILDILKENDVKAAFFITGQFVKTSEEIIKRMIEEGHIVGNHTVNHKSLPECDEKTIEEEIMNLHKMIYEKFDYEMKYMRPPKGEYSEKSLAYVKKLGYTCVMWSFAYDDWDNNKQGREDYGKKKVMENIHNGAILLLHATSKDNANILDYLIKAIKNEGYEFKSLDEFER